MKDIIILFLIIITNVLVLIAVLTSDNLKRMDNVSEEEIPHHEIKLNPLDINNLKAYKL